MATTIFSQIPLDDLVNRLADELEARMQTVPQRDTQVKKIWLTLPELSEYLPNKPSEQTIYGWVHRREIPFHKIGRRLAFKKVEIDGWIALKRRKTIDEIGQG
jgi:excisionase family DNA binding protein